MPPALDTVERPLREVLTLCGPLLADRLLHRDYVLLPLPPWMKSTGQQLWRVRVRGLPLQGAVEADLAMERSSEKIVKSFSVAAVVAGRHDALRLQAPLPLHTDEGEGTQEPSKRCASPTQRQSLTVAAGDSPNLLRYEAVFAGQRSIFEASPMGLGEVLYFQSEFCAHGHLGRVRALRGRNVVFAVSLTLRCGHASGYPRCCSGQRAPPPTPSACCGRLRGCERQRAAAAPPPPVTELPAGGARARVAARSGPAPRAPCSVECADQRHARCAGARAPLTRLAG
jgi:hypothetical protein